MPRDLPGLYWDETKQRYFPLSSRPASQSTQHTPHSSTSTREEQPRKKRQKITDSSEESDFISTAIHQGTLWYSLERLKTSSRYTDRSRIVHQYECQNIISSSRGISFDVDTATYNEISSFAVMTEPDGSYSSIIGDQSGWLYTLNTNTPNISTRQMYLGSDVASVGLNSQVRIAVPFGPSFEVAVQPLSATELGVWHILRIMDKSCHDIRSSNLLGTSLVLGAANRAILLPDVVHTAKFQFLPTGSDVLTVHQLPRLIYTGSRNGSIKCFDKRLSAQAVMKGQDILCGKYLNSNSSITHLNVINDWELLVATTRGDLEMFDLRYASTKSDPVMSFEGHQNSYKLKLGLAISPCNSILFAANDDRTLCAWSLRTGSRLLSPLPHNTPSVSATTTFESSSSRDPPPHLPRLFEEQFPADILGLQVTESYQCSGTESGSGNGDIRERWRGGIDETDDLNGKGGGMCLWMASGFKMYRYWLGQRALTL
ncbi:CUL4-DDB1 E3 ligase complex substrate receptor [Abortiporus biennis]